MSVSQIQSLIRYLDIHMSSLGEWQTFSVLNIFRADDEKQTGIRM